MSKPLEAPKSPRKSAPAEVENDRNFVRRERNCSAPVYSVPTTKRSHSRPTTPPTQCSRSGMRMNCRSFFAIVAKGRARSPIRFPECLLLLLLDSSTKVRQSKHATGRRVVETSLKLYIRELNPHEKRLVRLFLQKLPITS